MCQWRRTLFSVYVGHLPGDVTMVILTNTHILEGPQKVFAKTFYITSWKSGIVAMKYSARLRIKKKL